MLTARREIADGRDVLEAIVRQPVRLFAYPNGKPNVDYPCAHVRMAKELGFVAAVSTAAGAARVGDPLHQLPRFTPWDRTPRRWGARLARNLFTRDRNGGRVNAVVANVPGSCHARAQTAPRSIVLVGPLPPPSGGMANQTRQLAQLLVRRGCKVTDRSGQCAVPAGMGRGACAACVLCFAWYPICKAAERAIGGAELVHVMANSGWAWHLFAAPAVWIAWLRGVPSRRQLSRRRRGRISRRPVPPRPADARTRRHRRRAIGVSQRRIHEIRHSHEHRAEHRQPRRVPAGRCAAAAPRLLVTRNLEPIYDIATAHTRVRDRCRAACRCAADRRGIGAGSRHARASCGGAWRCGPRALYRSPRQCGAAALYRAASVVVNASLVDNCRFRCWRRWRAACRSHHQGRRDRPDLVEHEVTALLVPPEAIPSPWPNADSPPARRSAAGASAAHRRCRSRRNAMRGRKSVSNCSTSTRSPSGSGR